MRRLLLLIPVVLLFAVVGVGLFRARPQAELGTTAPAFSLPALDAPDDRINLSGLRGKPAVINFWASWCEPCRDEAEALARAARENSRINFLGIAMLDGRESALEFAQEFDVPYPSARDARGVTAKRYGVTGVPETVFLDERGRLVGKFIGAIDRTQLESILDDLIEIGPDELLNITGRGETRPVP
jgi:cytochrome c biogenesis protein CcmG/thiol:disulfide interchange protein DsbE